MDFVLGNLTPGVKKNLREKLAAHTSVRTGTSLQKQKWDKPQSQLTRKLPRTDTDEPSDNSGEFLELPLDAALKSCYHQFYKATSNTALEHAVCAVCVHKQGCRLDGVSDICLEDILSSSCLVPHQPHPDHTLFGEMLLAPEGIAH